MKGIHWWETGRKKLRRRGEERMKHGEKEERFFVVKKERETRFDVLLWSSRARRQGGRQSRSYSDITLASLRSYYCHATAVKRTEHLLASLTCKENFWSDENNTLDNETPFMCWKLEIYCINKFHKQHSMIYMFNQKSNFFNFFLAFAGIANHFFCTCQII